MAIPKRCRRIEDRNARGLLLRRLVRRIIVRQRERRRQIEIRDDVELDGGRRRAPQALGVHVPPGELDGGEPITSFQLRDVADSLDPRPDDRSTALASAVGDNRWLRVDAEPRYRLERDRRNHHGQGIVHRDRQGPRQRFAHFELVGLRCYPLVERKIRSRDEVAEPLGLYGNLRREPHGRG